MARQIVNIGTSANKGDGEPLRTAFDKINDNFLELYAKTMGTVEVGDIVGSVFGDDSTLLVDGVNSRIPSSVLHGALPAIDGSALTGITTTETDPVVGAITGIVKADGSGNISAAVAGTDYLTSVAFADLTGKPTTVAGYGITDALTSVPAQSFASLTGKPTTIAGYGITDAYTGAFDGDFTGSVFGDDSTLLVDGVNNKIVGAVDTTSLRTSDETIALGSQAGRTSQSNSAVAIGNLAGVTSQGASSIAIGPQAGMSDQGDRAVAIGSAGGATTQGEKAVAIGFTAGQTTQGSNAVAIGNMAGVTTQGAAAVAIGEEAGKTTQGSDAIAIGEQAGEVNQGADGIAIGDEAGQTNQGAESVAIGFLAGETTQAASSIAIGSKAGNTNQLGSSIAIGFQAGFTTQAEEAVAIGHQAGETNQAASSIAIGDEAGQTNQGGNTIAIGERAGHANQHANSIVINAQTETALDTTQTGEFLVKPVRSATGTTNLQYNATSGEVTHSDTITATSGTLGSIQLIDNNITSTDSTQLSIQTPTSFTSAGAPGVTIDGNITFEATGAITGPAVDIYGIGNGQVKIGNTGSSINPVLVGNANTAVTVEGDLTVSDEAKFQRGVQHKYSTIDSATGVTAHDCNSGQFFRHTNIAGDITVNLTNLNLNNGYSTEIVLLIEQGASARNVTALQIGGQAQTFHVQSGQNVNTNTKDTILIKLWRTGTGATDYIAMREIYNH